MNGTVNVNNAQCLYDQFNWGETVIHNVCNGTVYTVPWGSMDYLATGLIVAGVLVVVAFLISLLFD